MKLRGIGYACMNATLGLSTNHKFRLANLTIERLRDAVGQNLDALETILPWNAERGIRLFRVGSELIPFASHQQFTFDWRAEFGERMRAIGALARGLGIRLSMHPGQYTLLNSPRPEVNQRAIDELQWAAEAMEILDPETGTIVLHVGGMYGDKLAAEERFTESFHQLSPLVKRFLVLENDDTTWALSDVLPLCQQLGIPLVFDIYHHKCLPKSGDWKAGLTDQLEQVAATWGGRVPKIHLSSKGERGRGAHADLISAEDFEEIKAIMADVRPADAPYDIMVEAKLKDIAVLEVMGEGKMPTNFHL